MSQTWSAEQTTDGCTSPAKKITFPSGPLVKATRPRLPRHWPEIAVPLASLALMP
ncbi:hypothetical protein X743_34800 [Mesorhizobium sp. LNHC252B00]|nr:hypothetical protein X743_34800 [Mesorhizobium sp. LNHC252B00]